MPRCGQNMARGALLAGGRSAVRVFRTVQSVGGRGRAGAVVLCSAGHVNVNVNVPLAMPGQA